jgi:ATP-dependent RNA helicase DDX54/DBP10
MFASVGLKDYIYVKLDSEFFLPETMMLNFLLVSNEHKLSALIYLVGMVEDRCIVFASTRYLVDLIVFALAKFEISAVNIYGKMDQ